MKILQRFTSLFRARNTEEKIDTSKLTKEIATPALEGVRTVEYEIISTSMTPSKLGSTITSVLEGDAIDYLTLAAEMEERDCHYRAVLGVRKGALTSLIPTITVANSEDAKLNEIAEDVRNLVSTPEFLDMLTSLADALGKGYSVCEIMWEDVNGKWLPTHYIWRDPRFFST